MTKFETSPKHIPEDIDIGENVDNKSKIRVIESFEVWRKNRKTSFRKWKTNRWNEYNW